MKSDNNNSSDIDDRASEWVWKNDRGLTAAEQDAFTDWLSESQENRDAYAAHSFAWEELARLAGLQNTDYAPVVPDLLGVDRLPWYRRKLVQFALAALPLAASIALFIGYLTVDQVNESDTTLQPHQPVVMNHILQQNLDDGSVIDLNKGAQVEYLYTEDLRMVKLISGEANFHVTRDPSRPFIVEVAGVQFRAVGTVFNLRLENQKVDLIVTEGTVAVKHLQSGLQKEHLPAAESLVRQNFRASVDLNSGNPKVSVDPVSEVALEKELLWQPRLIDFEDAPLAQIVNEFNRRNPINIEVLDEEIGSLRFTSIFWSNNVESFVRLLEANYGITTEIVGDGQIILKKSPDSI